MAMSETTSCTSLTVCQSQDTFMKTAKLPPVRSTINVLRPNLSTIAFSGSNSSTESFRLPMLPLTPTDLPRIQFASPQLSPSESRRASIELKSRDALSAEQLHRGGNAPLPRLPSLQSRVAKQALSDYDAKDLAGRLALLLHARECYKGDSECSVQNCSIARGVLDHCQECFLADGQCHSSCSQAKHLLRHFRICKARNFPQGCQICGLLRTEFSWAMQHSKSLAPLFLQSSPASSPSVTPMGSINPASFGPLTLRRVVSDDPTKTRPVSSLPLPFNPAKRQRQLGGLERSEK
uniref:TAZ-type domain-containing protein n=1 Tax=Globisporangium ultimum (strain ATCC 200006 / CBS 805.95 / DAOM BR144) TaxID=431595 RepID=K3WRC6_GLOUD